MNYGRGGAGQSFEDVAFYCTKHHRSVPYYMVKLEMLDLLPEIIIQETLDRCIAAIFENDGVP